LISADYSLAAQGTDRDRAIAALVGSGQVWEALASALLHFSAPPFPPGMTPVDYAIVDALTRAFDPWARVVECVAVGRYALAARAARLSSVRSPAIENAWARLASYSDARIEECVDVVRRGDTGLGIRADPTFAPYSPGEFYRAPRGATADRIITGVSLDTLE
jgi:hypothetical protein